MLLRLMKCLTILRISLTSGKIHTNCEKYKSVLMLKRKQVTLKLFCATAFRPVLFLIEQLA